MTRLEPLDKSIRSQLERTVQEARDLSEAAALNALERLGVGEATAPDFLSEPERVLRRKLRAHGRQLGDQRDRRAETQEITLLVEEVAYEHWHRMLFARFLAENQLLMYPDPVDPVPVTLDECNDLAADEGASNGWELASRYAALMLPQIFRPDSPVFQLSFAPEQQKALEKLLEKLPEAVFHASDALGWVYQFWQAKKKEEVNKSEVKIGARELSPVTQLFTEPYMVDFLLDNSLGAWWAGQSLTEQDLQNAQSEAELRAKVALPDMPLNFLRFVKQEQGWQIAASRFDEWPQSFSEFTFLDPCCGSGHFLVNGLLMLVPMRMHDEGLDARTAVSKVLAENLYGLELDQRCVELAAFALALTAWRLGGGYFELPSLHLACTGLSISTSKEKWMSVLDEQKLSSNLRFAFGQLYELFKKAPTLGSLINPNRFLGNAWLSKAEMKELQGALEEAVKYATANDKKELGVTAKGLATATELLARHYTLVATNVPYLGRGKQDEDLRDYIDNQYPLGKADLATAFVLRCLEFCMPGSGCTTLVTPQNWLFLTSYTKLRELLLQNQTWNMVARLGENGFESSAAAGAFVALLNLTASIPLSETYFAGLDVSSEKSAELKAEQLKAEEHVPVMLEQVFQLENPDARIALKENTQISLLRDYADGLVGIQTGDDPFYVSNFWEFDTRNNAIWNLLQNTPEDYQYITGLRNVIRWEMGVGSLSQASGARATQGLKAVNQSGIAIHRMRNIFSYYYSKERFHQNMAVILPENPKHLKAIWSFCSSPQFNKSVREIDQKLNVTNATLVKVPFDLEHWQKVAEKEYPNGLPEPYSDDPTQWLFHGHPCGSVIWDDDTKWTAHGPLRQNTDVLQIATARLLGYRWPAELDEDMELAEEMRTWVECSKTLWSLADEDGIVCIPPVRGEMSAADRLLKLLAASYGEAWKGNVLSALLSDAGYAGKSLEVWLRDGFFKQHCERFQHRPFIWQIWDGLRDGFSVLVNYHKLDTKRLETLIFTYLGDWITQQKQNMAQGVDGAEEKLNAAEILKARLLKILEGEAPYDIFVRWKPLSQQPIGWDPDLNDGVRLNIRPFMLVEDIKTKDAGVLRIKPKIDWKKDRGKDPESAPWFKAFKGERINDHHLTLPEKREARSHD